MDLRKRILTSKDDSEDEDVSIRSVTKSRPLEGEDTDSACGDLDDEIIDEDVASMIPQHVITFADGLLSGLSPRWRNWIVRIISGFTLISGFSLLVWIGPAGLIFLTYLVMCSSYSEVLSLGKRFCNIRDQSTVRMAWIFFLLMEYFLVAPKVYEAIKENNSNTETTTFMKNVLDISKFLARQHEAIVFFSYLTAFVWFVLSMRPNDYLRRYGFFAWSHMAIFFLCIPGQMMNIATFGGMLWYVIPMSVITINDIAAYMVGFFAGKTPLIKLSPKKTKEGFIGGGLITILLGTAFSLWISLMPVMTCPVDVGPNFTLFVSDCIPQEIFRPYNVKIFNVISITWNDFGIHGLLISIFSSIIGPCGGFFASGFKRACKRKNFGSFIPGHGGVLDRCDCMFLMAAFTYIYQKALLPQI